MNRKNAVPIDESFFGDRINVNVARVFPVVVMATMSSGKSTLINALLETDILPSKNQACTAKMYSILDDDSTDGYKAYLTKNNGQVHVIEKNLQMELEKANYDPEVTDILIIGDVKGILNTDKSLLIIDTPGPNSFMNNSHEAITNDILKKVNSGLILYVINAAQMGIEDDKKLLCMLKNKLENTSGISVLFVINKIDCLDPENESISELVMETKKYLETNGIKNVNILPVSALSANLFKKVLNGYELTRKEKREFYNCYELFGTNDIKMTSYAITDDLPEQFKKIYVDSDEFTAAQLKAALENTGLPYLEKYIQQKQILSSENIVDVDLNLENNCKL